MLWNKSLDANVVLVAEIGLNHEGSLLKALDLVNQAVEAGADAVKFQSYTPERYVLASDFERFQRLRDFYLSEEDHLILKEHAHALGIAFFSSPVTEDWIDFLKIHGDALKIPSCNLPNLEDLALCADSSLPLIMSCGASELWEIERSVAMVKKYRDITQYPLILLHCVSGYPVPLAESALGNLMMMQRCFPECVVGYSHHTLGLEALWAAVAMGARVLEFHFTDCKENRTFRDHALSLDMRDLAYFTERLSDFLTSVSTQTKQVMPCESPHLIRKGLAVCADMQAGDRIHYDSLFSVRPATHFHVNERKSLVGRVIKRFIAQGSLLTEDDLWGETD